MKISRKKLLERKKQRVAKEFKGREFQVLNEQHHDPAKQLDLGDLVKKVVVFAQVLAEKQFYAYQVKFAYRLVESLLKHDGDVLTALFSRQSGKSEVVACVVSAIGVIVPTLARKYPDSWHLNMTDEQGNYRGFRYGVKIGIYAPKQSQSEILFNRVRGVLNTETAKKSLVELSLDTETNNGNTVTLSSGTRILCETASEQAKIEGETHNLVIVEEAQDVSDRKVRKSIHPMVAATLGTIVKIGTATSHKCDFYESIKANERYESAVGIRNHFFFPYQVCEKYNSNYRKYVAKEIIRLGSDSDEFLMSYACFAGDTEVITSDGRTLRIDQASVGLNVISHTGQSRKVTYKKDQGIKETVRLSFYGAEDVVCTPDHKFWTDQGWLRADCLSKDTRLLIPVPNRSIGPSTIFTKPQKRQKANNSTKDIPEVLSLDAELGELLGWYVAEGSVNSANGSQIEFSLSHREETEAVRIARLLHKIFGLVTTFRFRDSVLKVVCNSALLARFLGDHFGRGARNKHLPDWAMSAPDSFVKAFIHALWEGDGSYMSDGSASYGTASKVLWRQLDYLLRTCKILPSAYFHDPGPTEIEGRTVQGGRHYRLWVYGLNSRSVFDRKLSKRQVAHLANGYLVRRFKDRVKDKTQRVWDIEVETDHSFCLPSAAVHNCRWIFERGMFITQDLLFHQDVAVTEQHVHNFFARTHPKGIDHTFPYYSVVAGIDWGSAHDSTVVTLLAVDWQNPIESGHTIDHNGIYDYTFYQKHIVAWHEWIGDDYETQYGEILPILLAYPNLTKIALDSNSAGRPMLHRLQADLRYKGLEILGHSFSSKDKSDMYKELHADLSGRRLTFPAGIQSRGSTHYRRFVFQMLDLTKEYRNRLLVVKHPNEKHARDDYPDSLALANFAASSPAAGTSMQTSNVNFFLR